MALDPQYIDAIKGFEGYSPTASWDYKQNSNGYGTKAQYPGESIDEATANERFQAKIAEAEAHVNSVAPDAPPGVKAALTSLTYNAGPGWSSSGLGDLVRAGDWAAAAERFKQYNKAGGEVNPGLVARRGKEAAWFNPSQPTQTVGPPMSLQAPPLSLAPPASMPPFVPQQRPAIFPAGGTPPVVPTQYTPQQTASAVPENYWQQMPASGGPPPIFAPPRKQIDLSSLRAALQASGNRGFIFPRTA